MAVKPTPEMNISNMLQTMDNVLHSISIMTQQQSQAFTESGSVHCGARSTSEEHLIIIIFCMHEKVCA
jgi:hypothetical protein